MDQSFCPKNSIKSYPKSTSIRNFEEIKTILYPLSLDVQNPFFSFFRFYVFVNKKRTVIARKLFLLENIGISILFRMLSIRFRYIEPFSRNYDLKKKCFVLQSV